MKINSVLNLKEKTFFYFIIIILLSSLIGWGIYFYRLKTIEVPDYGGEYIEGIVGQPLHINPVLSTSNDTDADLNQIIYSSLFKYDGKNDLVNDLVKSWEISEENKTYTIQLRDDAFWHDGEKVTAKDVIFTLNLINNNEYKSPLRTTWSGVEFSAEGDYTLVFKTQNPYAGFLHNLTFGILPAHIWESVPVDKFPLTDLNLEPIGSGPYKYSSFQKDADGNILSYKLSANPNYYSGKPYISKLTFNFYGEEEELIQAYNNKEIMGFGGLTPGKSDLLKLPQSTSIRKVSIPRYFAVFLNETKSVPIAFSEVREALNLATNRDAIIQEVFSGNASPIYSPILPGMIGYQEGLGKTDFDLEKANQLLDDKGWKRGDDGIRAKDGTVLEFNLITTELEELVETAEILQNQWSQIGARVNLDILSISDLRQNYIRPREYDALLFGQVLGADPDLYSFWHSNQKKDPGLNLAVFGNEETDKLIEEGRVEFDQEKRAEKYKEFQEKLFEEMPAIFIFSPDYLFVINKKIQGIDISDLPAPYRRFSQIEKWYINTDRIWK